MCNKTALQIKQISHYRNGKVQKRPLKSHNTEAFKCYVFFEDCTALRFKEFCQGVLGF